MDPIRFNYLVARYSDALDAEICHRLKLDAADPIDGMLLRRIRVDKVIEEVGELHEAIIGVEGSNPRKGHSHQRSDIEHELMDVILTSFLALSHVSRAADVLTPFVDHLAQKARDYAGIEAS